MTSANRSNSSLFLRLPYRATGLFLICCGPFLAGCHDAYDAALQQREDHIHKTMRYYFERESTRPVSIERINGYTEQLQAIYQERLERALLRIEERSRARNEEFWAGDPERDAHFEDNARGDLNSMNKVITNLTP